MSNARKGQIHFLERERPKRETQCKPKPELRLVVCVLSLEDVRMQSSLMPNAEHKLKINSLKYVVL